MLDAATVPALIEADDPDILYEVVNERLLEAEDTSEEELRYEIASYGADYDVEGLVRRLRNGDVKIPEFQRGYVWPIKQASRFIESLVLGLPVPGIFLSTEPTTKKLLVIDGQQRLTTLQAFYGGIFPSSKREFELLDVQSSLVGKTYRTLPDESRRTLDNSIIHATVIKQTSPQDGGSSIYKIFERLNSSGMLLSPQEIRTAIYNGSLTDLLAKLNLTDSWRSLFGPINKRMRDQELILRFLALFPQNNTYKRPMKSFLNDFMEENRNMAQPQIETITKLFVSASDTINNLLGSKAFKPSGSFNAALFDSVMVGTARRLVRGPIVSSEQLKTTIAAMLADSIFSQWISRSTADDEVVKGRIDRATADIAKVA